METNTGLPPWAVSLIIAAAILVGAIIVAFLVRIFLKGFAHRFALRTKTQLDDILVASLSKPIFFLILVGGLELELRYLARAYPSVAAEIFVFLHGIKFTLGSIIAGWLVIRLAAATIRWYGQRIAARTQTHIDEEFIPIVDRSVKTVVFVLVLMAILSHFQVDIKGLVAVLGVASLAVALAAQDTLANMIAGFILMLDRPFRVGDRIVLSDGRKVDVHEIGLRSTKFMTFDHTLVIIPNAEIAKMTVNNLSYPAPRLRVRIDVSVAYGSDIEIVRNLLLAVAAENTGVLKEPSPGVDIVRFGESSLDFSLFVFIPKYQEEATVANQLRESIYRILQKENIVIPYPHRTIQVSMTGGMPGGSAGKI